MQPSATGIPRLRQTAPRPRISEGASCGAKQSSYLRATEVCLIHLCQRLLYLSRGVGAVLRKSDIDLTQTIHPPPEERYCDPLDEGEEVETTTMEEFATFEDITIWGHETVPEDADNPYAKGIQEWIEFAQAVGLFRSCDLCALVLTAEADA